MEVEKGHKSKLEIAQLLKVPKSTLSGWVRKADDIKEGYSKFGHKRKFLSGEIL